MNYNINSKKNGIVCWIEDWGNHGDPQVTMWINKTQCYSEHAADRRWPHRCGPGSPSLLHSGPFQAHNKTKKLLSCFTLVLSQEYSGVSQRLYAEVYMIIQLPFIKPNIKKIWKNVKQCHSFKFFFFVLDNIAVLSLKCYLCRYVIIYCY